MSESNNCIVVDTFPSPREVQTDVLEFYCQLVLQPCNIEEVYAQRAEGCMNVLEEIGDSIPNQGRLFNRTQLASLCCDLRNRPITTSSENDSDDRDDEEDDDADLPLSKLSPEMWKEYRTVLESVRSNLLRKDATNDEKEEPDDGVDDVREAEVKFNKDYDTVVTLLSLCETVAQLLDGLDAVQNSRAKLQTTLLRKLEASVDSYKKNMQELNLSDEHHKLLTNTILADLYQKKKPIKTLALQLQNHVLEVMTNEETSCGYAAIVETTRRLLLQWNNLVLGVPTLCKLGYGGFTKRRNSIYEDNNSVSSFGMDEEEIKERKQVAEEASSDDLGGYATATQDDDATADEADVAKAFQYSTQPPIPEEIQETPEKHDDDDDDDDDDGDKKPRAKRKIAETKTNDDDSQDEDMEEAQQVNKPRTRSDDMPRRSSRLAGNDPVQVPARKSSPTKPSKAAASKPKSVVYSEEEVLPTNPYDDDSSSEDSPPRKKAAVARKPPTPGGDDESITEPESSPRRTAKKKTAPVARRPPPDSSDDSSVESESKKAAVPPRARPVARRVPKKKPTVIEWSGSEDDDDIPVRPIKRNRYSGSSFGGGRRSSGGGTKKKTTKRFWTTEEKLAVKQGVERFGKGDWVTIRINSDGVLMSRTGTQIKDCYRTMLRRGEIEE